MKQFSRSELPLSIMLSAVLALLLGCGVGGISGGGGDDKPPTDPDGHNPDPTVLSACEKMCQNLGACNTVWTSIEACKTECTDMETSLRPSVVTAFIACGQRATCQTFVDRKACLREGAATVSVEVTTRMVDGLCAKAQACLGTAWQPGDCDKYRNDTNVQAALNESKIYTDTVELCFSGCVNNQTCTTLMDQQLLADGLASCSKSCGSRDEWITVDVPPPTTPTGP